MSRSYKKVPIIKDNGKGKKKQKRLAWRTVRAMIKRGIEIPNGNGYKKCVESWDICDYKAYITEKEAIEYYNETLLKEAANGVTWTKDRYPTLKDFLRWWRKIYKNK